MKAQFHVTLLKLLSAGALVAVSLSTGGCIAQAGTGTDSPGTSQEELTTSGGKTAVVAQPEQQQGLGRAERQSDLAQKFTSSTVVKGGGLTRMAAPPGTDPGQVMDDGDGREPDPHPWHSSLQYVAH